jgi:hypothetical protein
MKKIEVFLRHCYYSKIQEQPSRERPDWWDKQKVFENFKRTYNPETTNYTIIYDEFYGKIEDTFLKNEKNVHIINEGGEAKSFLRTLDYISEQSFDSNTIIYFLEDDYIHRPNWDLILMEAFELPVHYATLYDHEDKYMHWYDEFRTKILHTKSSHWMPVPSTTNTFATKFDTLLGDIHIHRSHSLYCEPSDDHQKFLELAQTGRRLVSALPGYSTHCHKYLLSPCIDWEKHL